ncbi:MAG: hypothetical protein AB7O43_05525 [Hyphomicrobiaceae bacterium]
MSTSLASRLAIAVSLAIIQAAAVSNTVMTSQTMTLAGTATPRSALRLPPADVIIETPRQGEPSAIY